MKILKGDMGGVMQTLEPAPFIQPLSLQQISQLQGLFQRIAKEIGAIMVTEKSLPEGFVTTTLGVEQFTLVVSQQFSALLRSKIEPLPTAPTPINTALSDSTPSLYWVDLTFVPEKIIIFLRYLLTLVPSETALHPVLEQASVLPRVNHAQLQSEFTLALVGVLTAHPRSDLSDLVDGTEGETGAPSAPSHREALQQQIEQERLLNQVMSQIRQSLELPVILQTAVEQVRQLLCVDRLVIYQLAGQDRPSPEASLESTALTCVSTEEKPGGSVIYEARASEKIPSVLRFSEAHCFVKTSVSQNLLEQALAVAIKDTELRYADAPCLLNFLQQAQVRAKLVAPIVIRNQLWGLLIAHQCFETRIWQEQEQRFLQQIAEHLSIAISQAQIYSELQQQKHTLEQRVIERTQELQSVMQAAQAANRAKSEFLAAVSHELRTPLTCIIGMSATLQRWTKEVLNARQYHFLQTIHDSGEYLLTLINDILDLSQAEAGKMVLNLSQFSLSRLAQQALKAFEGQAILSEVGLELDLHVPPHRDQFVADPLRVQQILFNLLDNAIKFTPGGGKVTLRLLVEENLAVFQVKDRGIGIPQDQLPFLFQKFRQLNAGYQRQYRGTGLGLALTKQLVELHGGWISVESTVEVGSIFTVKLPMQQLTLQDHGLPTRSTPALNPIKGRIVLIEPDEENAALICDVLNAAGYQIVWMLEGSTAVDQIEVMQPILVITNVLLPDIDGYSLIRCLRQNPATKHLKIIALTSANFDQHLDGDQHQQPEPWQTAGADSFLTQPIRPDHLLEKVAMLTSALAPNQG